MSRSTLSVVLPNRNHAKYLPRAIESILDQTRLPDEFLILDDASTDDSVAVIESYARRHSFIRFTRNQANMGVIGAHRELFERAQGDYVHPCAADDARTPQFLERAMSMAAQYPQAGILFGKVVVKNVHDQRIGEISVGGWSQPLYAPPQQFLEECLDRELATQVASPAVVFRRDAFQEVGWFRPELESWSDAFAARAIGLKYGACYCPEEFAITYRMQASYSQAVRSNPRHELDVMARAARLMRSAEFRDRFPESHVQRWERQYRRLVAWNHFLGSNLGVQRPSFLIRNLARLPHIPAALSLLWYQGRESSDHFLPQHKANK